MPGSQVLQGLEYSAGSPEITAAGLPCGVGAEAPGRAPLGCYFCLYPVCLWGSLKESIDNQGQWRAYFDGRFKTTPLGKLEVNTSSYFF